MSIEWVTIGPCRLACGDARDVLASLDDVTAIVTDPVWPNASVDLGTDDPFGLWNDAWRAFPESVQRVAVQLGCDSDPGIMSGMADRWGFFRACWLEYVRPHYKGRLLYTSDVAYFWGSPPPVRPGGFVIPGRTTPTEINGYKSEHPCPRKPQHVQWIVKWWTAASDVVCDPFMGSGTTAIACIQANRSFIGIEREPKYFDIACRRIEAELDRTPLFDPPPAVQRTLTLE